MNLQAIISLLIFILVSVSVVQGQTSQLPKKMPSGVKFEFHEGGGRARAYTSIIISGNTLTIEILKSNQEKPTIWSGKISSGEKEKLYGIFYENKFDLIKNDPRVGIVYDAGSETVSLSYKNKFYRATYGKNSPMSGISMTRYMTVSIAIQDFVKRMSDLR